MDLLGLFDGIISLFSSSRKVQNFEDNNKVQDKINPQSNLKPDLSELHEAQRQLKQSRRNSRESSRSKSNGYDRDI